MRKLHFFSTLVALSLATTNLWAGVADIADDGKLPGVFTINSNCDRVYFSQGNLQYIGSASTPYWKFADEQYEYFGDNGQNSDATDVDRDLFEFGTKDDPWCNSAKSNHSWAEWGENAISNGGNVANSGWRTLATSEWSHLLGSRSASTINGTSNARFAMAYLFGTTRGIILFPDQYTHPAGVEYPTNINQYADYDFTINQYSSEDWAKMEAAGCVFLPFVGYRCADRNSPSSYHFGGVGSQARFWCSGPNREMFIIYYWSTQSTNEGTTYAYAYSVRLVQNASGEAPIASVTTPPTPNSLTYIKNSAQALVTAGTAVGGTMKYRLGTSGSYSASIPTATNAGDYIVQYMVEGTGCFNDFTPDDNTINVTIAKASFTPSPMKDVDAGSSLTYNGSAQDLLSVSDELQDGCEILYSTDGVNWSSTIPQETNAGDYIVYYKVVNEPNYEYIPSPDHIDVTISPADIVLPSISTDLIYTGSPQPLLDITGIVGGTIYYSVDGNEPWLDVCPSETEIGTYDIWYKVVPDNSNYNAIAPTKVTVTIDDPYPFVADNADPSATLTSLLNTPSDLKVKRTIYADDEYNTICLPFDIDDIASSPLAGYNRLKTFKGAQVTGTAPDLYIDIFVEDATTIEAGVPYLITYPSAHADIVNPVFNGITVTATEPSAVSVDGITFQGMFAQVHIDPYTSSAREQDYLFLGANSQLYWPSSDQTSSSIKMRGFRAYFIIDRNSISPALAPKGTRARIMDAPKTTTDIDNTSAKFGGSEKIIENGILYIIRNGVKYNAQGQIVK